MEYEDKRTLIWAIYGLANMEITKQEFERRALHCVDETLELVKNLTIPASNNEVAVCPECKTKDTQVICCTCGHGDGIGLFR